MATRSCQAQPGLGRRFLDDRPRSRLRRRRGVSQGLSCTEIVARSSRLPADDAAKRPCRAGGTGACWIGGRTPEPVLSCAGPQGASARPKFRSRPANSGRIARAGFAAREKHASNDGAPSRHAVAPIPLPRPFPWTRIPGSRNERFRAGSLDPLYNAGYAPSLRGSRNGADMVFCMVRTLESLRSGVHPTDSPDSGTLHLQRWPLDRFGHWTRPRSATPSESCRLCSPTAEPGIPSGGGADVTNRALFRTRLRNDTPLENVLPYLLNGAAAVRRFSRSGLSDHG